MANVMDAARGLKILITRCVLCVCEVQSTYRVPFSLSTIPQIYRNALAMMNTPADAFAAPHHQPFSLPGERGVALLVHGFGGTPAELRGLGDLLHVQGWAAEGMLLPGFGADFAALPSTRHKQWIDAVRAKLAALRQTHRRVLLVGFSMGGAISVSVAVETPPDALVLINPFTRLNNVVWGLLPVLKYAFPNFKPFQVVKIDFESAEARRNIGQYMPEADLSDPAVQAAVMQFSLPTRALDELRAVGEKAVRIAPRLRTPTLVLQATRDTTVPPENTRRMAQRIAGARLVEIDAEHNFVQYDPAALQQAAAAILNFVS
jgi:carboxylesterase